MSHALDGAFDRVRRGEKHFSDLKRRIRTAEAKLTLVKFNRKRDRVAAILKPLKPFGRPSTLSIIIGECIYNLGRRSTISYLDLPDLILVRRRRRRSFRLKAARSSSGNTKTPELGVVAPNLWALTKAYRSRCEVVQRASLRSLFFF